MIVTNVTLELNYTTEDIAAEIAKSLGFSREEISKIEIRKKALDVTDKEKPVYKMTVAFSSSEEREMGLLKMKKRVFPDKVLDFCVKKRALSYTPLVVGAGPAGLFAALLLAKSGAKPLLIERGLDVDERKKKVDLFSTLGILDTECNVQFGEGGAGTYSDGKLKYGSMDEYKFEVLREFVLAGAPEDIIYTVSAHIGTDMLSEIVKKIRQKILTLGGKIMFSTKLVGINIKNEAVCGAVLKNNEGEFQIDTKSIILATGHSADDTFKLLFDLGVKLIPRGFGIGVRIEHPREYIDDIVYGKGHSEELPTASYHLVTHLKSKRSVYSFCMCPGGVIVPATNKENAVVTNGMSEHRRDGENSNSALLVSVFPEDFGSSSALAGIEMQRSIERRAFFSAGGNYKAPVWRIGDFVERKKTSEIASVKPSYPIGTEMVLPESYLPDYITDSLREAIFDFDEWLPGFYYPDALLTGVETRSTSPIRVQRNERYESVSLKGLYPAGEGAGYAGGIVSSATDGLRAANALLENET